MAAAATKVNVHLADNVPSRQHGREVLVDVELRLEGAPSLLRLRKESVTLGSVYEVSVPELSLLGLPGDPAADEIAAALDDLVLALNLQVPRGVFSRVDVRPHALDITEEVVPPTTERDEAGNVTIRAAVRILPSSRIRITLTSPLVIDQGKLLETYRRVRRLREQAPGSDLVRAAAAFTEGCRTLDLVAVVRNHATAIELGANAGRPARQHLDGAALDAEAARISGFAQTTVQSVRVFYNRTKHAGRHAADRQEYEMALQNIWLIAWDAKLVAAAVLQARLPLA